MSNTSRLQQSDHKHHGLEIPPRANKCSAVEAAMTVGGLKKGKHFPKPGVTKDVNP